MQIINYQLVFDDNTTQDLPHLATDAVVRVWAVTTALRANGLFVSYTDEIPGCDHTAPIFTDNLPAHPDAVLAASKAVKNSQINEWRLAANQSTFPYANKTFACDLLSRSDIDGVANSINLAGAFPTGFPNAWKAVDNTYIPINTLDDFKAFYNAMTAQGTSNFAHSQSLKQTLANATTVDQVNAISWS